MTAEYRAYTEAQLAWIRQERGQLDFSASCMAPCFVLPASVTVNQDEDSPILTLDLGKLEVSTSQFDDEAEQLESVAYEANTLKV